MSFYGYFMVTSLAKLIMAKYIDTVKHQGKGR